MELNFTTEGQVQFENLADQYIALAGNASPPNFNDYKNATDPQLRVIFLNRLLARGSAVTLKIVQKVELDLNITADPNPEIG